MKAMFIGSNIAMESNTNVTEDHLSKLCASCRIWLVPL